MKSCSRCKQTKDHSCFSKNSSKIDGLNNYCKDCMKSYRRSFNKEKKEQYYLKKESLKKKYKLDFFNWLKNKKCVDCGNSDFRVLEFDHLSDKSYNISDRIGTCKLETLMLEIVKCDIVCANCHRIRTAIRGDFYSYLD